MENWRKRGKLGKFEESCSFFYKAKESCSIQLIKFYTFMYNFIKKSIKFDLKIRTKNSD